MDPRSVKELFALQSKVGVPETQRVKSKATAWPWCLIYWIIDKQVSIESLTAVAEEFRKEGEVSDIRFKDGKKYPGKILRIGEDKKKLQEEQTQIVESFEHHSGLSGGEQDVDHLLSKRNRKKSSKLVDFISQLEEEEPGTSKTVPSVASKPAMPAKKNVKKADSRATKLKEVADKAKVQRALCKEMLTCQQPKPVQLDDEDIDDSDTSDIIMEDISGEVPYLGHQTEALEDQVSTLKRRIKELENKLQERERKIVRLQQTVQVESAPYPFSVEITPKKIRLMKEVTALLQTSKSTSEDSPQASHTSRATHLQIPPTPELAAKETPTTATRPTPSTNPSLTDESLTPLNPNGVPLLSDREKRVAFNKGVNKEALLFSLLAAVFGEERLARGKACGTRKAHNIKSEEATTPLDSQKLDEIKECVLRRFKQPSGQPCLSLREFNEKINQKCATCRRALKKKQALEQL